MTDPIPFPSLISAVRGEYLLVLPAGGIKPGQTLTIKAGETVTITQSQDPEMVTVPRKLLEDAAKEIDKLENDMEQVAGMGEDNDCAAAIRTALEGA